MLVFEFAGRRLIIGFLLLIMVLTTTAGTSSAPPAGASGVDLDTFYDNFNDNSIDTSLWVKGSFGTNDPLVAVSEVGGQLEITPRASQTGSRYNGLMSSRTYNFTGGIVFAEVVETTQSSSQTMLAFGVDNNNKVSMMAQNGSLHMALTVAGSNIGSTSIAYSSSSHRWWRIRHVPSGDTIRFDTSPDGIVWTQRHSITRGSLNITTGKVNLSAGTTSSIASPGRARFDNLSWHPLVPNKGDWSAPTTALSRNPTPGTWDNILWGAASPSTVVKFNGKYFLYYIGAAGDTGSPEFNPVRRSLGVATSDNGINFTKYSGNPIVTYTTTNGTVAEEGVGGATAIVVGNTIHLYYAAIRSTGGEIVDLDIRYRKSTDGYNFTSDTLIYRSPGDEYAPLGVIYSGGVWSVYIKGPLTSGKGPLSRLSGTSPTSLPTKTVVTSTTFGSGGNANFISPNLFVMHLDRRETTEDRFQVRAINASAPNTISEPLFAYTFGNFGDHATPATFKDDATGNWFMYTLNLSVEPAVISVRTYSPSNMVGPTSTSTRTPTRTPTSILTATRTPTRSATVTRTPTGVVTFTRTPTRTSTPITTFTRTPTRTLTPTAASALSVHIGDLDGLAQTTNGDWAVEITITVHNSSHAPVANAAVTGNFSNGYKGPGSCTTDTSGVCRILSGFATTGTTAITFTVTTVSVPNLPYSASSNHDLDGNSNGSMITVQKP